MTVDMSKRNEARMKILEEVYAKVSVSNAICTSDTNGEFVLTSSDSKESSMERHTITINSISELKTVAGNPNELYEMNLLSYPTPIVANISDRKELSLNGYDNTKLVCDVMSAYIYGNSELVQENEALLNRLYFPMDIACFGSPEQDIVVTKEKPLVIDASSGKPVHVAFRKVTLEEGAKIEMKGNVDFSSKSVVQNGEPAPEGTFRSVGYNGGSGGCGGNGANGANGGSGVGSCTDKKGADGSNGQNGSNGMNGGDAQSVTLELGDVTQKITICSIGGSGGNGGNGGCGGNGGNGGDGIDDKNGKDSGNGGNGGNGGKGGDGGKTGNGMPITVTVTSGAEKIRAVSGDVKGGNAGSGGNAGAGGNPGKSYGGGKVGTAGAAGTAGAPGTAGAAGRTGEIKVITVKK